MLHRITRNILATSLLTLACATAASAAPTLKLSLVTGQGPVEAGQLVQVVVSMSQLRGNAAAGFQAFIHFDTNELTFINGAYTPIPFGMEIISPVTATVGGDIDIASGINQFGGQSPSNADAPLAYLTFISVHGGCQTLSVQFRTHNPPTRITKLGGAEILPLTLIGLQPLPLTCAQDVDHNNFVDTDDLLLVINHWGQCPPIPACCTGDVDHNGYVDTDDLLAVILHWGICPP